MISDEMEIINAAVQEAFKSATTLSVMSDTDLLKALNTLLLDLTPYRITTSDGVANLSGLIFTNAALRDLILTTQFHLFSRCPEINYFYEDIVSNMARGMSCDTIGSTAAMPVEVIKSLGSFEFIRTLLLNNKWIVTTLLIILNHEPALGK